MGGDRVLHALMDSAIIRKVRVCFIVSSSTTTGIGYKNGLKPITTGIVYKNGLKPITTGIVYNKGLKPITTRIVYNNGLKPITTRIVYNKGLDCAIFWVYRANSNETHNRKMN